MVKVVVADDHAVVREGLKRIIAENPFMSVAGEASTGTEAIQILQTTPCDVLVLDISMPDKNGMDVLKAVHGQYPKLPVLILSMHSEDQYAIRVLRAGAAGYVSKESAPNRLVDAIQKVVRGGKYVSTTLAERLIFASGDDNKPPHEVLSDREYQVLCMIGSGKTVGGIAIELGLSVKTVSTYRSRILEKLSMKNNSELTRYVIKAGLVD